MEISRLKELADAGIVAPPVYDSQQLLPSGVWESTVRSQLLQADRPLISALGHGSTKKSAKEAAAAALIRQQAAHGAAPPTNRKHKSFKNQLQECVSRRASAHGITVVFSEPSCKPSRGRWLQHATLQDAAGAPLLTTSGQQASKAAAQDEAAAKLLQHPGLSALLASGSSSAASLPAPGSKNQLQELLQAAALPLPSYMTEAAVSGMPHAHAFTAACSITTPDGTLLTVRGIPQPTK